MLVNRAVQVANKEPDVKTTGENTTRLFNLLKSWLKRDEPAPLQPEPAPAPKTEPPVIIEAPPLPTEAVVKEEVPLIIPRLFPQ